MKKKLVHIQSQLSTVFTSFASLNLQFILNNIYVSIGRTRAFSTISISPVLMDVYKNRIRLSFWWNQ